MIRRSKTEEIRATVTHERFRKDDFFIVTAKNEEKGKITIKGNADPEDLSIGLEYRFMGRWVQDPKWGEQFVADFVTIVKPHTRNAIINYVTKAGKGLGFGRVTAERLWELFGADCVQVLKDSPKRASDAIKRLTPEVAEAVSESLQRWSSVEETCMELYELIDGRGFPKAFVNQAIQVWGNKAPAVLAKDPYKGQRFPRVGFKTCDSMYLDLGLPPDAIKRQAYCAAYSVASDTEGHVWFPVSRATNAIRNEVKGEGCNPEKAVKLAIRAGILDSYEHEGELFIAEARNALAEKLSAESIVERWAHADSVSISEVENRTKTKLVKVDHTRCERCRRELTAATVAVLDGKPYGPTCIEKVANGRKWEEYDLAEWQDRYAEIIESYQVSSQVEVITNQIGWPEVDLIENISDHQRFELGRSLGGPIAILGGSPGTGKTWTAAQLVKCLIARGATVGIAAPTGKAAVRLNENLAQHRLPVRATTIHRLLKVTHSPNKDDSADGWKFTHNRANPLPQTFLLIDESSMLDIKLFRSLLSACSRETKILFIGDVNQLPPVGCGAPLRDLIKAGLPYGELTEIRRNAGSIVKACAKIRDGETWSPDPKIDLSDEDPKNLTLLDASRAMLEPKICETIVGVAKHGFDPIWDLQVIVPTNVCRKSLNDKLQSQLNPQPNTGSSRFRVNDKIICLSNSTFPPYCDPDDEIDEIDDSEPGDVMIANGEIGVVLKVEAKRIMCEFWSPTRKVIIPLGQAANKSDDDEKEDVGSVDLAYAITVHKSQGSSAPIVLVALEDSGGAKMVCSREWIYTAISRAEKACMLIGKMQTVDLMARNVKIDKRKTMLAEMIWQKADELGVAALKSPTEAIPELVW